MTTNGATFWWGYGSGLLCAGLFSWYDRLNLVIVGALFMIFAVLVLTHAIGNGR